MSMNCPTGLRDMLRKLAAMPEGITPSEVPYNRDAAAKQCHLLVRLGQLYRGRAAYNDIRYFTTQEAATAYVAKAPKQYAKPIPVAHKGARAWWDKDAPVVITAETRVTIAPPLPVPTRTNTHSMYGG